MREMRRMGGYYHNVIHTLCGTSGIPMLEPPEPEPHAEPEPEPEPSTHAEPSTDAAAQVCINITHIRSGVVIYCL